MQCKNSQYKIVQGISYMQWKKNSAQVQATCNVNLAKEGIYKVLVTCIKEVTGKGFQKVQDAWNVKESEREFHKV